MTLTQTIVLITGSNQGLGLECVKKLAAEQSNYHIILCSRDSSKGAAATKSVTNIASGNTVEPLELDITSDESIANAVKTIESKYGRLDVLFNNAGISNAGGKPQREEWIAIFNVNVISTFTVTEAFVPLLRKSSFPKVVFMSSGLGSVTDTLDPNWPFYGYEAFAYSSSKSALNMVAAQYAVKYKKDGFKVNVIDPGFRATNLNAYNEHAGKAEDGATEACRIIVQGKDGQYSTFTSTEGLVNWYLHPRHTLKWNGDETHLRKLGEGNEVRSTSPS